MLAASVLVERLLDLALQRNFTGFQQSLKQSFACFELSAWAVVFPASAEIGGRPVFMAHGIRSTNSPLLALASKEGLETIFPRHGPEGKILNILARDMSPNAASRCHVLRTKPDRGGEVVLFAYRGNEAPPFSTAELDLLTQVAPVFDRCFLALAEAQEHEFQAGLFRIVANLHPEGICVLGAGRRGHV